ncbi:nitroreductase family protein [Lentibacillus amyloliquefaciens]|uniref:Nitroreductase n=1 Tax=Lentibacillus amyloliquefaciens TaxID=1472767 RepID=A0A0U4DV22_9BACI|nr:nitroreductase [Lentibacillus amyloliquefaciens]ALX49224.1 nitroreductase [Lentibacillus amyloliquefaciens]
MEKTKQPTALQQVIRDRRAVKKHYNDKHVSEETVKELLADAVWAPTHGVRQPWRFIFIGPEETENFAEKVAATYPEHRQQDRFEYLSEPTAFLIVVMEEPESRKQWDENFGATASMIQNFWLLAWEQQLGIVWKTNSHIYDSKVKALLDVGENEKIVGFLHLGYFDEKPAKKDRISAAEKFTRFEG